MEAGPNLKLENVGNTPERSEDPYKNNISSKHLTEADTKHSSSPDDVILASSPYAVTSTEPSGPSSPREGVIPNFGVIDTERGIYRSSFPHSCNIEHLKSLKLRTVITLVSTAFESDVEEWLALSNVQHFRIKIPAHKSSEDTIPMEDIAQVMKLMIDGTKGPILIHCNKGRHRTGCITACYRKLHGMNDADAITEYHEYARTKARAYDIAFISGTHLNQISQAVSSLRDSIEPICYRHLHHISNDVGSISIAENRKLILADREIFNLADESERSNILLQGFSTGRSLITPEPPLTPPFSIPINLGFNANELVDALSRVEDRRHEAGLTPPQTPLEYHSKYPESTNEPF